MTLKSNLLKRAVNSDQTKGLIIITGHEQDSDGNRQNKITLHKTVVVTDENVMGKVNIKLRNSLTMLSCTGLEGLTECFDDYIKFCEPYAVGFSHENPLRNI